MYPLKLKPVYDQRLWGRNRVPELRGDDIKGVGVSWEISAHPTADNEVVNGKLKGKTMMQLLEEMPKEMLGDATKDEMLRCAFSDPKSVLSIQDHPDDEYAYANDNECGKTESWYVIDAIPGAALLAGAKTTDKKLIEQAIKDEKLEYYMNYIPVKTGDFVHIQQGEIHALGPGILILEVAGNSDLTYRLYDFGRKDNQGNPRELHLDKGLDVLNLELQSEVIHTPMNEEFAVKQLVKTPKYTEDLINLNGEIEFVNNNKFSVIHVVSGDGIVIEYDGVEENVDFLGSVFIPAACKIYKLRGKGRVARAYPNQK